MAEILIASFVFTLLLGSVFSAAYVINGINHRYRAEIDVTSKARLVIDRMAFGIRAGQSTRRGLAEAVSATIAPSQVDYMDIDGVTHSLRYNAGNIEYRRGAGAWNVIMDPNGSAVLDPNLYSVSLAFSQTNPRAVDIQVVLGRKVQNRWQYASLSTSIAFRNA